MSKRTRSPRSYYHYDATGHLMPVPFTCHRVAAPQQILIANRSGEIRQTNYFDTELGQKGLFFLSWNASVARILVPDSQVEAIHEMRTGTVCVITQGLLSGQDMLEIMFDDHSDAPYMINIPTMCSDRLVPDDGRPFTVAAWTRDGKVAEWPGRFRKVRELPCLQPW